MSSKMQVEVLGLPEARDSVEERPLFIIKRNVDVSCVSA